MFKEFDANTFVYSQNSLYQLKTTLEGHITIDLEEMIPEMDIVLRLHSLLAIALLERNLTLGLHNIPSDITTMIAKL